MNGQWGDLAREHWQHHLPDRYAALEDPDRYFELLDQEATAYYLAIRDGILKGVSPNDGTIAWANDAAREIVATELICLPSENNDEGGCAGVEVSLMIDTP